MVKRTDHRPAPRIEYRGHATADGVLPAVEVVRVYEEAEPLKGWNVGYGFAWGMLDQEDGPASEFKRAARRELAFRLVEDLTGNAVLADDLADGIVERLLLTVSGRYGFRITAEQLLGAVEELLMERELAKYRKIAAEEVERLLDESAREAKRRRIAELARKSQAAGRPTVAFMDYRDGESEVIVTDTTAGEDEAPTEIIDLHAPPPPVEAPTAEDLKQLQHDPHKRADGSDDPNIPW